MDEVKINEKKYSLTEELFIDSGVEGSVYKLSDVSYIKKYQKGYLSHQTRLQKLIALEGKKEEFASQDIFKFVTFPEDLAYELQINKYEVCGFSMKAVPNAVSLTELKYSLAQGSFKTTGENDKRYFGIVTRLFEILAYFHNEDADIIIGDVQPGNILVNAESFEPYIIDFDSVKFGEYPCGTFGFEDFLDPTILKQGVDSNGIFLCSTSSDISALTQVCFDFLIGVKPYSVPVIPVSTENELKLKGINYVSFENEYSVVDGFSIGDKSLFKKVKRRIDLIQKMSPEIFHQFVHVFRDDGRENRVFHKAINTEKSEEKILTEPTRAKVKPVRGYLRSKDRKDPDAFISFINRFKLELP